MTTVDEKLKLYDPEKTGKESKFVVEDGMKLIGWTDMAMRFAKPSDKILFGVACLGVLCFGAIRPGFSFFFGRVTDGVGGSSENNTFEMLKTSSFNMMLVGLLGGVFQFMQTAAL